MGFFIFALHFLGSNHELQIGGPGIAVEVLYQVCDVFTDPMEEMVFELLLHLLIHDPSGALQPDLIEGPSSLVAKEGTFLWLLWVTL